MTICPRCKRVHSGICGIPAGVTLGYGARIGSASHSPVSNQAVGGKPKAARPSTAVLEGMLTQGKGHLTEVMKMLRVIPAEMPEYKDLLDRESRLSALIKQVEGQIAARRGGK